MAKDYAQLAKRISTYTTNGLFSAVVLLAGLAFARQTLQWWAEEPAESSQAQAAAPADGLGSPTAMHLMDFGNQPWSMASRSMVGDRRSAVEALRGICREMLTADQGKTAWTEMKQPGPAQQRLLDRLRDAEPAEEEPGKWRIYQFDGPFPMVAGVDTSRQQAKSVVTWGLAVPSVGSGDRRHNPDGDRLPWTLYALGSAQSGGRGQGMKREIPLPPDSRETMSVAVEDGQAMVAFRAAEPDSHRGPLSTELCTARRWTEFYDQWFEKNGWPAASDWRRGGSASHARYKAPDDSPTESVEISFDGDSRGRLAGLMIITPKAANTAPATKQSDK